MRLRSPLVSKLLPAVGIAATAAAVRYLFFTGSAKGARRDSSAEPAPRKRVPDAAVARAMDGAVASLAKLGFGAEPLRRGSAPAEGGGTPIFYRVLEAPELGDVATVIASGAVAAGHASRPAVWFSTEIAGGASVHTTNAVAPFPSLARHGDRVAHFPRVTDARRLHALHRAHVRRTGRALARTPASPPMELALPDELPTTPGAAARA